MAANRLLPFNDSVLSAKTEFLFRDLSGLGRQHLADLMGDADRSDGHESRDRLCLQTPNQLVQQGEGAAALRPKAEYGEVMIKGSRAFDAQAAHDGEAGAVDDREVLVGEGLTDLPGAFQIGGADGFDAERLRSANPPKTDPPRADRGAISKKARSQ